MDLNWAEVITGTEQPLGIGTTGAARCMLRASGKVVGAILKRGPREHIVAEAFCALLLHKWGVPVPEFYLTEVDDELAFASVDTSYPNLSQRLSLDSLQQGTPEYDAVLLHACQLICALPSAPLAATADEAIDNRDRNLGNVLWDGVSEAWIDHAYALGNAKELMDDVNKLCLMAVASGSAESFSQAAIASWMIIDRKIPAEVAEAMKEVADLSQPVSEICSRLSSMGNRLTRRFPQPDDLLSEP